MFQNPQAILVLRNVIHDATISWGRDEDGWTVSLVSPAFEEVEGSGADAFEALCRVREVLEPQGWKIGVAGAQADVWPSGMARDQGGGLQAYRLTPGYFGILVDTFAPVDPATVVTLAQQRAEVERLFDEARRPSE